MPPNFFLDFIGGMAPECTRVSPNHLHHASTGLVCMRGRKPINHSAVVLSAALAVGAT